MLHNENTDVSLSRILRVYTMFIHNIIKYLKKWFNSLIKFENFIVYGYTIFGLKIYYNITETEFQNISLHFLKQWLWSVEWKVADDAHVLEGAGFAQLRAFY